jgi:hypothetical protein
MLRYLERVINVFKLSTKPTQPSDFLGLPAELRVKIYTDIILAASRCTFQEPGHGSLFWVEDSDSLDLSSSLDPAHAAVRRYEHVPGLHALRLTCHWIKDELDHEILRRVVQQVNDLLRDLNNLVGRLHGISLHTSWIDRSLSRTISKPGAFRDVQNLRISGCLQDIYKLAVSRHISHRGDFLQGLAPHVRSLTFNLMRDQCFSNSPSAHTRQQFMIDMELLVRRILDFMTEKAYCAAGIESDLRHSIPPTGVREIRINVRLTIFCIPSHEIHSWRARSPWEMCALNYRHERNVWGHLTVIVISISGGDRSGLCTSCTW